MFSPAINHRLAIAGTYFVLIAAMATGMVMVNSTRTTPQVRGVSTTVASTPVKKPAAKKPGSPNVTALITTSKPVSAPSAQKPQAATDKKTVGASTDKQGSTAAATTANTNQQSPSPAPAPAPGPATASYSVSVGAAGAPMAITLPDGSIGWQVSIPFTVTFDSGFAPAPGDFKQPSCSISGAAASCDVILKDGGSNLGIIYASTTPAGTYTVTLYYPIGDTVRTGSTTITI